VVDQEAAASSVLGPAWRRARGPIRAGAAYVASTRERRDRHEGRLSGAPPDCWPDLAAVGIDVDCLRSPMFPSPARRVIGDRAYGKHRDKVATSRAGRRRLAGGGVLPVLKHIPGTAAPRGHHGVCRSATTMRTLVATDFAASGRLRSAIGMTAHVVYTAIDPLLRPTSATLVRNVIGTGWDFGLLMSDDISMGALAG